MSVRKRQFLPGSLVIVALFLLSIVPAFATDCTLTTIIRCDFDDDIFAIVDNNEITISQSRFDTTVELTSMEFAEILSLLSDFTEAGNQFVEDEQLAPDASFIELVELLNTSDEFPELTRRLLSNGNIFLSSSSDGKANLYLLTSTGELQMNIGPDIDGNVQVLVLLLFSSPIFYEDFSFNIYEIDFAALNS